MTNDSEQVSTSELMDTSLQRKSARRRRHWTDAQKRQIVAETQEPGASVSIVARRYDVNANQLFLWRRELSAGAAPADGGGMLPVEIGSGRSGWAACRASRGHRDRVSWWRAASSSR